MAYIAILNKKSIIDIKTQKDEIVNYCTLNKTTIKDFLYLEQIIKNKEINPSNLNDKYIVLSPLAFGGSIIEILNSINLFIEQDIEIKTIHYETFSCNKNEKVNKADIFNCIINIQKDIISYRTKKGLEATKKKGVKLGRPKGVKNKNRIFDEFRSEILESLNNGISLNKILKNINEKTNKNTTYPSIKYYIENDIVLKKARDNFLSNSLLR